MAFKHYQYPSGDNRRNILNIASFGGHLVGAKRGAILALLAGGFVAGEVTGVNDSIRQRTSSVLMTPPDQGRVLQSVHSYLRKKYHPDGEAMR